MAVGIIALVIGAAALGFTVYQSFVSVPNQISSIPQLNQRPATLNVTIEWTTALEAQQDRFFPDFMTIAQGDTIRLTFVTNDTADGHTFTISLPTSSPGFFQLNNSFPGQNYFLTQPLFTTESTDCSDHNGTPVACNTVTAPPTFNQTSKWTFQVTVPGTYSYYCQYHARIAMFGCLIVLSYKGFTE